MKSGPKSIEDLKRFALKILDFDFGIDETTAVSILRLQLSEVVKILIGICYPKQFKLIGKSYHTK